MDPLLEKALNGMLRNPEKTGGPYWVRVDNQTALPLNVYTPNKDGDLMVGKVNALAAADVGKSSDLAKIPDALYQGYYLIFVFPGSGGAAAVLTTTTAQQTLTLRAEDLT